MKNFIYFALILTVVLVSCSKEGESENSDPQLPPMSDPDDICTAMDDINFMSYCYENFDINKDGKVSLTEAKAVQSLNVPNEVKSIKGIQYFSNITNLQCITTQITSINVSRNTKLLTLTCRGLRQSVAAEKYDSGLLTKLDISKNLELTTIECSGNLLTSLDISKNSKFLKISCNSNRLKSLDLTNNKLIQCLRCNDNLFTSIDISMIENLITLNCSYNPNLSEVWIRRDQRWLEDANKEINFSYID